MTKKNDTSVHSTEFQARALAVQVAGPDLPLAKRIADFMLRGDAPSSTDEPQEGTVASRDAVIWNEAIDAVLQLAEDNAQYIAENLSFEARDTLINRVGDLKRDAVAEHADAGTSLA